MRNFVRLFKLITARAMSHSDAKPACLVTLPMILVLFAAPTFSRTGDSLMATMHGTVTAIGPDGQSHDAPGAKVQLIGTSRESSLFAVADNLGEYRFGSVLPGNYKLEVALDGFENVARPITIHAGEMTVENVRFEVKRVRKEITVSAARESVDTSTFQSVQMSRNLYAPQDRELTASFGGSHFIKAGAIDTFNGNASLHFVSARNETIHFPKFFSLETQVLKGYRLRVSPGLFTFTKRFYPRDIQGNKASANSGIFSNGVGRMFGMRFVIEKK
jgi:hypothetical protein